MSLRGDAAPVVDLIGGAEALRPIVADFVARICRDPMIGFHFRDVDQTRLTELEWQFAAQALGAPVAYAGRPVGVAHKPHPISDGHFSRRKRVLQQVLADHAVPEPVQAAWLAHTEKLRASVLGIEVVRHGGGPCDHPGYGPLVVEVDAAGQIVSETSANR